MRVALLDGRVCLQELQAEVLTQLRQFVKLVGAMPRFLDGHQHVHILPGVPDAVVSAWYQCCRDLGCSAAPAPTVRIPSLPTAEVGVVPESLPDPLAHSLSRDAFHALIHSYCHDAKLSFTAAGWTVPAAFVGYTTMGADCTVTALQSAILEASSSGGMVEVMTHPGKAVPAEQTEKWGCGTGADEFSQSPDRETEAAVLQGEELRRVLTQMECICFVCVLCRCWPRHVDRGRVWQEHQRNTTGFAGSCACGCRIMIQPLFQELAHHNC